MRAGVAGMRIVAVLAVVALGLGAKKPAPAQEAALTLAREQARWQLELELTTRRAQEAENQLADLQEERARLIEHMKRVLAERNAARADAQTLGETLTTITDEGARWREAAEQRRGEIVELQQQLAMVPPEPPDLQVTRQTYQQELREARRDAEYLWDKERQKLERRHADELAQLQQQVDWVVARLADTEVEFGQARADDQRQFEEQTKWLSLQAEQSEAQAEQTVERARQAVAQIHQRTAEEVAELRQRDERTERELRQQVAALSVALKRTRDEGHRRVAQAEAASRESRVANEQLRSGMMVDWAKLYIRLGVLESQLGHLEAAEQAFQHAIQLQPTTARAYYNLGILYDDHLQNGPAAIAAYEQYLLLAPKSADAKTVRGWIQMLKGIEKSNQDRRQWDRPGLPGLAKTFKDLWS